MASGIRIAGAAVAVLWLPGQVIAEALHRCDRHRPDLATSVGLSVAGISLLALYATLAHVRIGYRDLAVAGLLGSLVVGFGIGGRSLAFFRRWPVGQWRHKGVGYRSGVMAMGLVFVATLTLRFLQVRDLALPAWVDSLHHTLIVQIIRDQGQLPDTWQPYMPVPFYYHFGFHVLTAAFAELADLPSPRAVLVLGQVLNAAVVLSIYRLGAEIGGRREVGIAAAVLTGFVSQMPAYYASWGRYTLLTGMVLLPIAMATALAVWRHPHQRRNGLQLALMTGGIMLVHYLAAAYFLGFLLALALVGPVEGGNRGRWHRGLGLLAWGGLGGAMVVPWLLRVVPHVSAFARVHWGSAGALTGQAAFPTLEYLWNLVNHPGNWVILLLAAPAVGASLIARRPSRVLVVWVGILALLSTEWPWQVRPFRADLLVITLFVAENVLAAEGLFMLRRWVSRITRSPRLSRYLWCFGLAALGAWGFSGTRSIINPVTVLATAEDVKALEWIAGNVPPGAKFLINVEPWAYGLYRGSDGGWWIPLIGHRATILPPGVAYGQRVDAEGQRYILEVKRVAEQARAIEGCTTTFWQFVREQSVTHIYIGAKGGRLQPRWFDTCAGVRRVYMGNDVHIYAIEKGEEGSHGAH